MTATDDDLVRAHLDGDPRAFDELVRRHEARVYAVCVRVIGDADEAADAAQDAFLAAYRKLAQFRGDARFTTWLHRIAVNACYDSLRRRSRQPMLRLVDDEGAPFEAGPAQPDHADQVVGSHSAAVALASIPEEFRVAIVLADVEDIPYDEIASILDVPVGTVKSRVHRGRIALAKAMGVERGEPRRVPRASQEEP